MPKSAEERLDEAVLAVVEAAKVTSDGEARRLTIDIASAEEYPYRLEVTDEQYPRVGLARP